MKKSVATLSKDELQLTKLDVAIQQLCTAIRLFFTGPEHVIAVHTLACASATVLRDILKHRGSGSILRDVMPRAGKEKVWNERLSRAQNFFKHADKDPLETSTLRTTTTHALMVDAIDMASRVSGLLTWEMFMFWMWYCQDNPELLMDGKLKEHLRIAIESRQIDFTNLSVVDSLLRTKQFCEPWSRTSRGLFDQ